MVFQMEVTANSCHFVRVPSAEQPKVHKFTIPDEASFIVFSIASENEVCGVPGPVDPKSGTIFAGHTDSRLVPDPVDLDAVRSSEEQIQQWDLRESAPHCEGPELSGFPDFVLLFRGWTHVSLASHNLRW